MQGHAYWEEIYQALDKYSFIFKGLTITLKLECPHINFSVFKDVMLIDRAIRSEVASLDSVTKHEKFQHREDIHSIDAIFW